jgi:hypothetical protein
MTKRAEYTGVRFTRLQVLGPAESKTGRSRWFVVCDCGQKLTVLGKSLASGNTKSCGCLNTDMFLSVVVKHGLRSHPLYGTWKTMIQRCTNPNTAAYANYGGRGITVCSRWKSSFQNFLSDMGDKPTKAHTLERANNNKGYTPGNCYWATRKQQAANKRPTRSTAR